jgi:ATP-dependent helicase/nuclease subunit B
MAVTFILGRAGAGKTHACLSAMLRELARTSDTRRLILLVPEQASFQMERALATQAPGGGYWRAEVLSFSRLAWRVFGETGREPALLSAEARALALRHVVAQAGRSLHALRRAARTQGFYAELDRLIEELLREDVPPHALRDAAARLADGRAARKVADIAQLYADYLRWLGPERIDAAARLVVLRARLAQVEWLADASIWVDGFAGFTGQELQTLVELARRARDVTISLLVDPAAPAVQNPQPPPDPLDLFQRTELTYQRLRALLADAGIRVTAPVELQPRGLPRFAAAPALAVLEAGLATPFDTEEHRPRTAIDAGAVRLYECSTRLDELRAAARWIRTLIADAHGAAHFRDFAVIARDLEPVAPLVAEVFAEYEIPYFLDRRRPMRAHPLARLLPALLAAAATDCHVDPMVRLLRTRLLPLSRDEAEQLENLVVNYQVRGRAYWRRPTWELERGEPVEAFAAPRARIAAALEPLAGLIQADPPATGAVWAKALYRVLEDLNVRRQIEGWIAEARAQRRWEAAETHRLAWGTLCGVLQDLHDALGTTPVAAGDVAAIVRATLGELTLGLAPPTLDQVLVSSIERSRHPDIKHAWVLAFNEGVFPARPPDDLLLSTAEREALHAAGLTAPSPHRDDALGERLLAYIAFTRPSHSLTISYATVADDGGALLPSPLLAEVARALPGLKATRAGQHEPPVAVAELAREYLSVRRDPRHERERRRYERLCAQVRQMPARAGLLDWLLRGLGYRNGPQPVGNFRGSAAGVVWNSSPSEVETYLQCPFKHFATYGLRLDAARGPRPLRWDLGQVGHEILARVTRRAMQAPGGVRAVAEARWQEWLQEAVDDYWSHQPPDEAERRPDLVFMGRLLTGFLREVVAVHAARWRRGHFEPLYCETKFEPGGGDDALVGVELRLPDGSLVRLHGQIDRVDVCVEAERLLLVYDYKSGRVESVKTPFLTGHRLQAFLYLLALQQAFAGDRAARPAGVFLAPLYPDLSVLDKQYVLSAAPLEQAMYMYRPRGLVEEEAARRLDDQLGGTPSPVAQLQLKKDGGFFTTSDALPAAGIESRLQLAVATVRLAAEGVCAGQVDVAPLVENCTLACRNCDFQPVCRFDPMYNTPRPAERALPQLRGAEPEGGG